MSTAKIYAVEITMTVMVAAENPIHALELASTSSMVRDIVADHSGDAFDVANLGEIRTLAELQAYDGWDGQCLPYGEVNGETADVRLEELLPA